MIDNISSISVKGASMFPLIIPGDSIQMIKFGKSAPLSWGDIIVFLYKGELIAHRIILLLPNKIVTKGDNSLQKETLYSKNVIIGKVLIIKKQHGYIYLTRIPTIFIQYVLTFISLLSFALPYALYRCLHFVFWIRLFFIWLILERKK